GWGGSFHIEIDGANKTGAIAAPYTGGWDSWQTVTKSGVYLAAGKHVMRVVMDTNSSAGSAVANFNWFNLVPTGTSVAPVAAPVTTGAYISADIGGVYAAGATAALNGSDYDMFAGGTGIGANWDRF